MNQLRLPPAAANADPPTSREADREITRSGQCETQTRHAAALVAQAPGLTALELARRFGEDRHDVAKRLADANHAGLVRHGEARRCSVSGRRAVTWVTR